MEFACRKNTNAYKALDADSDLQFKVHFVAQEKVIKKDIKKPLNKAKRTQNVWIFTNTLKTIKKLKKIDQNLFKKSL